MLRCSPTVWILDGVDSRYAVGIERLSSGYKQDCKSITEALAIEPRAYTVSLIASLHCLFLWHGRPA